MRKVSSFLPAYQTENKKTTIVDTLPRNNIKPTIPLVAFSCLAEYLITILNNSDGKIVDLLFGSFVSHLEEMIVSSLQASVSLVLRGTARFELTELLILLIKPSIPSNRKTPHDLPSISEIDHLRTQILIG